MSVLCNTPLPSEVKGEIYMSVYKQGRLAVLVALSWSGAGSFAVQGADEQTDVAVSLQAGKTRVVLHKARGW